MSAGTRIVVGFVIVSLPFACSIPDERSTTEADGGTAGAWSRAGAGTAGFIAARAGSAGALRLASGAGTAGTSDNSANAGTANSLGTLGTAGNSATSGTAGNSATLATSAGTSGSISSSAGATAVGGGGVAANGGSLPVGSAGVSAGTAGAAGRIGTSAMGGTAVQPATGGAPVVYSRDCRSAADNDHNGIGDQSETQYCQCKVPNEVAACTDTSKFGVCRNGAKTCIFSADNTTSSWSACVTPAKGSRLCASTADNDCNGLNDNTEKPCEDCGKESPKDCGSQPEYWGKGLCRAGASTLITTPSECTWSECTGEQGPTQEACGPDKTDANCNGVAGDGGYGINCLQEVHLCSAGGAAVSASSCTTGQTDLVLKVFKMAYTNTTPLVSCSVTVTIPGQGCAPDTYKTCAYVAFGACNSGHSSTTLGYVATTAVEGYMKLSVPNKTLYCNGTSGLLKPAPVLSDGCSNCVSTTYYAIP